MVQRRGDPSQCERLVTERVCVPSGTAMLAQRLSEIQILPAFSSNTHMALRHCQQRDVLALLPALVHHPLEHLAAKPVARSPRCSGQVGDVVLVADRVGAVRLYLDVVKDLLDLGSQSTERYGRGGIARQ